MFDLAREDVLTVVDQMVGELLVNAECGQPPVDAIAIAKLALGMTICLDRGQRERGRAQRNAAGSLIYLRPEPRATRRQWTVAHEIGEHLRPRLWQRLGQRLGLNAAPAGDDEEALPRFGESLANLFAYRLLVPQAWFVLDARRYDYDLTALKARYRTASHEVIAWRMLDQSDPCVITVVDNGKVSRRRSNAWRITRALAAAEAKCLAAVHTGGRQQCVCSEGWSVHGWPVHEPEWRREILRSVRDDEE